MKRFQFRLAGLLRIRKVEEERLLQELRQCQGAVAAKQQERDSILIEKSQQMEALRTLETGPLSVEKLLMHRRYLNALSKRALEEEAELRALQAHAEEAQKRAETAARERQVVERLRDRRYQEYREQTRREESADLDELTQIRSGIRKRETQL